jgi:putative FmdB family regulatory protein
MPVYEFRCDKCKKEFDLVISLAQLEAGEAQCPHCDSRKVTQLMSSGLIRKGNDGYAGKIR